MAAGDVMTARDELHNAMGNLAKTCQLLLAGERAPEVTRPVDLDAIVARWHAPFDDELLSDGSGGARRREAVATVVNTLYEACPWPLDAFHVAALDWQHERLLVRPGDTTVCSPALFGVCEAVHNYIWCVDHLIRTLAEPGAELSSSYRPELVQRGIERGRKVGATAHPSDLIVTHLLLTAFAQRVPEPQGLLEPPLRPGQGGDPLWLAVREKLPPHLAAEERRATEKQFANLVRSGTLADIRRDLIRLRDEIGELDVLGRFLGLGRPSAGSGRPEPVEGRSEGELPVRWLVELAATPEARAFSHWTSDTLAELALRGGGPARERAVRLLHRALDEGSEEDPSAPFRLVARVLLALLCAADDGAAPADTAAEPHEAGPDAPSGSLGSPAVFEAMAESFDGRSLVQLAVRLACHSRRALRTAGRGASAAALWRKVAARFFPMALADKLPGYLCLSQFLRGVVAEAARGGGPDALFCIPEAEARTTFTELCGRVLRFAQSSKVPELDEPARELASNQWVRWLACVEREPGPSVVETRHLGRAIESVQEGEEQP